MDHQVDSLSIQGGKVEHPDNLRDHDARNLLSSTSYKKRVGLHALT
ncbi:hypothetical protein [Pseudomonas sp. CHM02]|nr:hypothetical protein [Pseudomonas sp. CHM02]